MDLQSLAIILYSTSLQCLWAIVWNQLTSHHWKWWRHCLWSLLKQASCAHCSCVSIPTDMYQVPVQRLDRIRTSRKRVKEILTDIGLNSCQDFLKVGSSLKKQTTNKVLYKWFKNDIKRGTKRMHIWVHIWRNVTTTPFWNGHGSGSGWCWASLKVPQSTLRRPGAPRYQTHWRDCTSCSAPGPSQGPPAGARACCQGNGDICSCPVATETQIFLMGRM